MNAELVEILAKFNPDQLERLRETYAARNDSAGVAAVDSARQRVGLVQTPEAANCGRMQRHRKVDEYSGRVTYTHTGDIASDGGFGPFMRPGITGKLNRDLHCGEAWAAKAAK